MRDKVGRSLVVDMMLPVLGSTVINSSVSRNTQVISLVSLGEGDLHTNQYLCLSLNFSGCRVDKDGIDEWGERRKNRKREKRGNL